MISKKGDFNFVWLFAILAGIAFLLLAIFFAVKFGGTLKTGSDASIAKSIEILADPLQVGFAESSSGKIFFQKKTQINPSCYDEDGFGYHMLSAITESEALKNNPNIPIEIKIPNKYIFAQPEFGKEFYVFSKKFELGFPVTSLLFVSTKEYCLINPPQRIVDDISGLNLRTLRFKNAVNDTCSEETINVCFAYGTNCNMTVYGSCYNSRDCEDQYSRGTIQKESGSLKYAGNLIYGAILSEKESYECNVKRLLYRTSQIAETYLEKANLMDARGCATNLNADLLSFSQETMDATVDNLFELFEKGSLLKQKKEIERGGCGVW